MSGNSFERPPVVATIAKALAGSLTKEQLARLQYHADRGVKWCIGERATRLADPPYFGLELAAVETNLEGIAQHRVPEAIALWEMSVKTAGFDGWDSRLVVALQAAKQVDIRTAIKKAAEIQNEESSQQDRPVFHPRRQGAAVPVRRRSGRRGRANGTKQAAAGAARQRLPARA